VRTIVCPVALGLILLTAGFAPAQEPRAFPLMACNTAATDVVVTDADGRVMESWRGGLQPGEVVRLGPARLSPANALPCEHLRLRPERALSGFYRESYASQLDWWRPRLSTYSFDHGCRMWGESSPSRELLDPPLVFLPPLPVLFWPTTTEGAETELRLVLFLHKGRRSPDSRPSGYRRWPAPKANRIRLGST
jgi:hypothetical protein